MLNLYNWVQDCDSKGISEYEFAQVITAFTEEYPENIEFSCRVKSIIDYKFYTEA